MRNALLLVASAGMGSAIVVGQLAADRAALASSQLSSAATANESGGLDLQVQPIGGGGPDVIAGSIINATLWGQNADQTIVAYSFGAMQCNIGDAPLAVQFSPDPDHPINGQNLFRLHNGRFEQLGQKWVAHGICSLQLTGCGTCTPFGPGCAPALGVGCSDPSTSTSQGATNFLGPKQHVNPATGTFALGTAAPFFVTPAPIPGDNGFVHGRLQAHKSDLYNVNYPGARFFAELHYIAADDAAAGNGNNNASWREVAFAQPGSPEQLDAWTFPVSLLSTGEDAVGGTNREEIAMFAWQEFDDDPDNVVPVTIVSVDVPGDGRFYLGYKVVDNDDGTYTYEYAIHNLNSDRSARSFAVPHAPGVAFSEFGFHDVFYHWHFNPVAGAPPVPQYSDADWPAVVNTSNVQWATQTFAENENANALRWGTLYNFRFTADRPPVESTATLGLFKPGQPGSPNSVSIPVVSPGDTTFNPADLNEDGFVNGLDLGILLANWSIPPDSPGCNGMPPCAADINGDGVVDGLDLGLLLANWTI